MTLPPNSGTIASAAVAVRNPTTAKFCSLDEMTSETFIKPSRQSRLRLKGMEANQSSSHTFSSGAAVGIDFMGMDATAFTLVAARSFDSRWGGRRGARVRRCGPLRARSSESYRDAVVGWLLTRVFVQRPPGLVTCNRILIRCQISLVVIHQLTNGPSRGDAGH